MSRRLQIDASIAFFSAAPGANVVGATASLLLECDEAQDVDPDKWEKDFRPMGATANVTTVLYGTPWREDDLLAQAIAANRAAEARDGVRRHFQVDWSVVARANPDYGRYVAGEIARLGEHHPIVRTQYLLRTLAGSGRFLDATQLALLEGEHRPEDRPEPSGRGPGGYVAGLDVAGADEEDPDGLLVRVNPRRDSTVLTVAYAEEARVSDLVVEPRVRVVRQYAWRGTPYRRLYPTILELVRGLWRCRRVAVDATGVGGGLAAFLGAALGPGVVEPYVYTAASASRNHLRNTPDPGRHNRIAVKITGNPRQAATDGLPILLAASQKPQPRRKLGGFSSIRRTGAGPIHPSAFTEPESQRRRADCRTGSRANRTRRCWRQAGTPRRDPRCGVGATALRSLVPASVHGLGCQTHPWRAPRTDRPTGSGYTPPGRAGPSIKGAVR